MSAKPGRSLPIEVAEGWRLDTVLPPSPLRGANGIRFGPDGELHVCEGFGDQISAIDVSNGHRRVVSPSGGPIIGPDDLDFTADGAMFVTEPMAGRVSIRTTDGKTGVFAANLPGANGIAADGLRIFVDESRPGGRLLELYRDGRKPRLIAEDLPMPNALRLGPDGYLYFPLSGIGEVWRVSADGGAIERCTSGLSGPCAVKFSPDGSLVVCEGATGRLVGIDLHSGRHTPIAQVSRGIDNFDFGPDGKIYLSSFLDGNIFEVAPDGSARSLTGAGCLGPWGLSLDAAEGLLVADGLSYLSINSTGEFQRPRMILDAGFPGIVRNIMPDGTGGILVATAMGTIARMAPDGATDMLATGCEDLTGLAQDRHGAILATELEPGNVLRIKPDGNKQVIASGMDGPAGIAVLADGSIIVAESRGGRVVALRGNDRTTLLDGLDEPQDVSVNGLGIFIVEAGSGTLWRIPQEKRQPEIIARNMPIRPTGDYQGASALRAFAGVAARHDGPVFISTTGDGGVLRISRCEDCPPLAMQHQEAR